jgi:invasion protein IalB
MVACVAGPAIAQAQTRPSPPATAQASPQRSPPAAAPQAAPQPSPPPAAAQAAPQPTPPAASSAADTTAASPPAPPAAAPPAAASQAGGTPRPWAVSCTDPQPDRPRECRLAAAAFAQPQNQRVLTVTLMRQPETRSLVFALQVAHGAALPAGVTWQVDEGEAQRLAFQSSDAQGVYAAVAVADDLLAALRRGSVLRVSFAVVGRRETLTVAVPLATFAEASAEFFAAEQQRGP